MKKSIVLILRPLGLGDLLAGMPAMRALRAFFPGHRIILAAPRALAGLADLSGAVDEVADTAPLQPLDARLQASDVAVDLHGRGPASQRVLLAAHPHRLIAFENPAVPQSFGQPAWDQDEHEVSRWCRLLRANGIPADPQDLDLPAPRCIVPHAVRSAVVVHPGAKSGARRWPAERWSAVTRWLASGGHNVAITGNAEEAPLAAAIARDARIAPDCVLAGQTNLLQLAALVARAKAVVSGDTGVAHLATAYRRPSVVLFGPMSPRQWGPPPGRPWHRVLWKGTSGDPLGAALDRGLLAISVEEVITALTEALAFASPATPHRPALDRAYPSSQA